MKDFKIYDRVTLRFRGEFINAFNHSEFSAPTLSPDRQNFGLINSLVPGDGLM